MQYINQRNIKIVDELMNFCYFQGCNNISIHISTCDRTTTFSLEAIIENLSEDILEDLDRLLNCPRCHEMEEYYWELNGNDDIDCKLSLIGMMIDNCTIRYDNSVLSIVLKRTI